MTFLSVIVPTRERCETLHYALKNLSEQDFADAEFIVSDNVSNDDTTAVMARFNDARIRYIRTPHRLSMTGNYDFALGHARGTYVTILGDDDGFVPGALSVLAKWAQASGADAISWQEAAYYWPTHSEPERRNLLEIPVLDINWNVPAKAAFAAAKWTFLRWNYLPIIYGGLVKLDVMNKLRQRTGNYLLSRFPDVYSAIAICSVIDSYIYTEYPFSVFGFSGKSMASSYHLSWSAGKTTNSDTFAVFLQENTTQAHADFPVADLRLETAAMADCFYRVRDALFEKRLFIPVTMWLYRLLKEASDVKEPLRSEMLSQLETMVHNSRRGWLVNLLTQLSAAKSTIAQATHSVSNESLISGARLNVDARKLGVSDIYAACDLVSKLRPLPTVVPTFSKAGFGKLVGLRRLKDRWTS
jgi:glycosyltransferase involved in cell wall biosynthesis